jgi:hypothetical protein
LRATEVSDGRERGISSGGRILAESCPRVATVDRPNPKSLPQLGTRLTGPVPGSRKSGPFVEKKFSLSQKTFFTA